MAAEKNFENRIKKYIEKNNGWYVKFFANAYTKSGIPDILCCLNGRFLGIEVKQESGKPSELQEFHLQEINKIKGLGILAYPSGFDELKEIIDMVGEDNQIDLSYKLNEKGYIKCKEGE